MHRRPPRLQQRRIRWTALEIGLFVTAMVCMTAAIGLEGYSWLNPPSAPAAPRAQEQATATTSATSAPATAIIASTASPTLLPASPTTSVVTEQPTNLPPTTTLTPTVTFVPTWTPLPTFELTEPPLTVDASASIGAVNPGAQFSYFLTVTSSSNQPRQVELRQSIDSRLDILEASSNSGACSIGYPVVCTVAAAKSAAAQIIINVRVPAAISPGSVLVSQALARDDQRVTTASERIEINVVGANTQIVQVTPTASPVRQPAAPVVEDAAPAAPGDPTDAPPVIATATPATVALGLTIVPTETPTAVPAPTASIANSTQAPLLPTIGLARSPISDAAQSPTPALPPTLAPLAPNGNQPANSVPSSVLLPRTAATVPAFGLGVALMGVALTLHSTRRIRRADARLTNAGAALGRLGPLVDQANVFQRATAAQIDRMTTDSSEMADLLEQIKPNE